ncbi:hypothetical protein [Flavobacterium macrobrachii]|uniref:DUF2254 domain-containing protein n=1 Tax=Flavobacterium macrobrachii TaxID=591204 RepID=A0ABS2CVE2_9FLAO|nr:hypothetical protein [Flavobacterium macrobrachii]MBM6498932.1 hypothetical protein [Flavobacterium macrobrachii]
MLRSNNIWLRHRAKKEIKRFNKSLYNPIHIDLINNCHDFISNRNNWAWVFMFVIFCFWLPTYINFETLNVLKIDISTVKTIVDQRTTNLATIISISLVVVGFLINNLAVKSPITYKLLFKKSLLYLTIYLTLSTIFVFIIASTLRDSIPEFEYTRLVLGGTYLCLLILFIIGYLFRKIIHFTSEKEISKMLSKELLNEGKKILRQSLIKKYSNDVYKKFIERYGTEEYNFIFTIDDLLGKKMKARIVDVDEEELKYKTLTDVNLLFLRIFIWYKKRKRDNRIYYKNLRLDEQINYIDNDILWMESIDNSKFEKFILRKCLRLKKIEKSQTIENIYRNEFDQKIIQLAEENKYRNLEEPLDAYIELYKLQMINQR